jgi:hypothetical protein
VASPRTFAIAQLEILCYYVFIKILSFCRAFSKMSNPAFRSVG